jgi:hypothetical protein
MATQKTVHNTHYKRAVGVFKNREDIEKALHALKDAGVDMKHVSLLARHVEDIEGAQEVKESKGNEAKEGAAGGATAGTILGGVGGLLVGIGVLAVPGVGPLLAAGAGIPALASTLAGAGIGAASGGIIGALVGAGIPEERAKVYNERIKAGDHLLVVNGTENDIKRIESIMRDHHAEEFQIYDAPDLENGEMDKGGVTSNRETSRVSEIDPAMQNRPAGMAENNPAVRGTTNRSAASETRDIDNDGDPEVFIVDKRDNHDKTR